MSKPKIFLIINIVLIIFSILFISILGKSINGKFLDYSKAEVTKISKYVITFAVSKNIIESISTEDLIVTNKNSEEEIKSIEFNVKAVNLLLFDITSNVLNIFKDLENGKSDIIDLSKNALTNTEIKGYKNGIIFEIPMGVVSDNFILSNLGPKIPVKATLNGEMSSHISTSIVEYGINNALITVYVNISISMKILLPFLIDQVTVNSSIPISMSFINGKVPSYYTSGMNSKSPIFNLPIQ